jgi:Acyl-ACP thioesterase
MKEYEARGILTKNAFIKDFVIRYSDIDEKNGLSPAELVNILQSECIRHSAAAGHDLDWFRENKRGWALSFWHIWINEAPKEGDVIRVETWSKSYRRTQAHRDLSVISEDGSELVHASTRWVLMDMETRHPVSTKPIMDHYCFEEERPYRDETFDIPECSDAAGETSREFTIMRSDLDVNRHTNNSSYVKWAMDDISDEIFAAHTVCELVVKYHIESSEGQKVRSICRTEKLADGRILAVSTQVDANDPETVLAIVASYWK